MASVEKMHQTFVKGYTYIHICSYCCPLVAPLVFLPRRRPPLPPPAMEGVPASSRLQRPRADDRGGQGRNGPLVADAAQDNAGKVSSDKPAAAVASVASAADGGVAGADVASIAVVGDAVVVAVVFREGDFAAAPAAKNPALCLLQLWHQLEGGRTNVERVGIPAEKPSQSRR